MNGSSLPPQLRPGFRQRLLPTPAGSVPVEYAETLRAFCATVPGIEAAYVCAVENVYDGAEPVQALRFCAQLTSPTAPFRRGKRTRCASTPAEPPPGGELAPEDRDDP